MPNAIGSRPSKTIGDLGAVALCRAAYKKVSPCCLKISKFEVTHFFIGLGGTRKSILDVSSPLKSSKNMTILQNLRFLEVYYSYNNVPPFTRLRFIFSSIPSLRLRSFLLGMEPRGFLRFLTEKSISSTVQHNLPKRLSNIR